MEKMPKNVVGKFVVVYLGVPLNYCTALDVMFFVLI